jgi:hypothetical protein
VDLKVLLLHDINKQGESLISVTTDDVREAVARLKNGKAADELGLAAEHIKHGGEIVLAILTRIINHLTGSGKVPELFKTGLVTSVYKKNKKPLDQPIIIVGLLRLLIIKLMDYKKTIFGTVF